MENNGGREMTGKGKQLKVMVIDDSLTFLSIAVRFLREHEAHMVVVGTATSGTEGLVWATSIKPDVFLVDLNMPGLDGFHTIARLREMRPDACIIAISLSNGDPTRLAAVESGADTFVKKSNMTAELVPAILRCAADRGLPGGG